MITLVERAPYPITPAVLQQRRTAALKHGARSPAQISTSARAQKRRLLRQMGLKASDLDGVGLALLDGWARAQAKAVLMDEYFAEHGFLKDDGEPSGAARTYFACLNSARLSATRLSEHLKARGVRGETLEDYLTATYGESGDGDDAA